MMVMSNNINFSKPEVQDISRSDFGKQLLGAVDGEEYFFLIACFFIFHIFFFL